MLIPTLGRSLFSQNLCRLVRRGHRGPLWRTVPDLQRVTIRARVTSQDVSSSDHRTR